MTLLDDKAQAFLGADLDDRFDCFGEFDLQDDICFNACAIRLSCAICKNINLDCQLIEEKSRLDPHPVKRDLV
ncbi:MAG: hypothetical protein LBI10_11595 [Deltaproteobacteria bacterium]|jgi:hypothetical protein|nr:hypothetical protein [Deltaproteobacteria bacterium]